MDHEGGIMAKTKADWLKEAKDLGLVIDPKTKLADIKAAVETHSKKHEKTHSEQHEAKVAKAGKRSEKGVKDADEKLEKIEKQHHRDEETQKAEESKPKKAVEPARPKIERRSKKYKQAAKLIDKSKVYSLSEALDLAVKTSTTKFDSTIEVHVRLNVDPKQADQNIRDSVVLPGGTGKTVRIAVFADDENAKKAKAAGADIAGNDDFLAQLDKEVFDFDVLIAMPNMMAKLAKYARTLGPKGLMPSPKSGTVTADVARAVEQAKAGKIEYRVDSNGIIHIGVGKVSFGADKLKSNTDALFASIKQNKPASIKSTYVNSIVVTTTMGPGVKVSPSEL